MYNNNITHCLLHVFSTVKSIPQRYVVVLMCFTAVVSLYLMRVCLAISMTQMVKSTVVNASAVLESDQSSCVRPLVGHDLHASNGSDVDVDNLTVS